mmetsp:Transcript_25184/g.79377  ORF Transcript_25184/g.79377 Transcript_25184/m.79377 type:complete len:721 (+) Transcript_25184:87-2249(+)
MAACADFATRAFWQLPLPLMAGDRLQGECEVGGADSAVSQTPSEPTGTADFWRLPLPELEDEGEREAAEAAARPDSQPAESAFRSTVFWSLPLPAFEEPETRQSESPGEPGAAAATNSTDDMAVARCTAAEPAPAVDATGAADTTAAGCGTDREDGASGQQAAVEVAPAVAIGGVALPAAEATATAVPAEAAPPKPRKNLVDEMTEMLSKYAAQRDAFQRNLEELVETQARLRALTVRSSLQYAGSRQVGTEKRSPDMPPSGVARVPPEIVARTLWHLDFTSLVRATHACPEWARLARSKVRWQWLCETDWGVQGTGSWQEYRLRLGRWQVLQATLTGLKGSGCPSGICGSLARRRLFEALEALVELGAAPNPAAQYPSQVPALLHATGAGRTLLALLEDESPYLVCLAARCLADFAAEESERPALRGEVVQRGALVRRLLEGEDVDVMESAARLMLNLHGGSPGTPLSTRRRGPTAFSEAWAGAGGPMQVAATAAAAWSGVWTGEMRYARGGERHAALRLILGAAGDPAVEQAAAALRAAEDGDQGTGGGSSSGSSQQPRLRTEGGAEYWHYFGFLAESDFDCAHETLKYVDEQLRRQREKRSAAQHSWPGRPAVSMLAGAGWDEQNGAFVAEAPLPQVASHAAAATGASAAMATAVPLRLTLRYETRGTYELTAFLAEGAAEGGGRRVPVLYGVWATAPSQHKHLFALRQVAPLPMPE